MTELYADATWVYCPPGSSGCDPRVLAALDALGHELAPTYWDLFLAYEAEAAALGLDVTAPPLAPPEAFNSDTLARWTDLVRDTYGRISGEPAIEFG